MKNCVYFTVPLPTWQLWQWARSTNWLIAMTAATTRQRSLRDIFTNVFLLLKYGGSERSFVRWRGFVPLWNVLWVSDWLKKKTLSWRMQVWHSREFLFSVSNQFSSNCYFQTWQQRRILYSCIYPGFSFNFWFGTGRKTSSILLGWIFMNTKFERELLKIRDH